MTAHDQREDFEWDPSLLDAARAIDGPSAEVEQRLLDRLDRSISASADSGDRAAPTEGLPTRVARFARSRAAGLVVAFAAGIVTGRVTKTSEPAPQRAVTASSVPSLERRTSSSTDASVSENTAQDAMATVALDGGEPPASLDASGSVTDARAIAARRPSARPQESEDLVAETNLMDMARSALARGRAEAAIEAVEQHARSFSHGQLAEDRESLAVQALVTLGRTEQARRRAESFRRRWPNGLYRSRVEAAIALIR